MIFSNDLGYILVAIFFCDPHFHSTHYPFAADKNI